MLFSSISFLFFFFPVVLFLYFGPLRRCRNLVLLVASLFFYFSGEPHYFLLMVGATCSGWLHGFWIQAWRERKHARVPLISAVCFNLAPLLLFKYADFFIETVNGFTDWNLPLLKLSLPLGISFYTFQILSYSIDLYRGKAGLQRSFWRFLTYVSFFPQLIAGPIVRYTQVETELTSRTHTLEQFANGMQRFLIGLGKKVLIANLMGEIVNAFSKADEKTVLFYWLYAIAYTLQIYFDFSSYSDMAIGLGAMFGFQFPENFQYPYISVSITEFWRRWHMTLSLWFRDYVYIPMGGNRVSLIKQIRNLLVVWILTGFWHGASWNFLLWGLYFGVLLIGEKFLYGKLLEKLPKIFRHVYTMLAVIIGFVLFNAANLRDAWACLRAMFGFGHVPVVNAETMYTLRSNAGVLLMAVIGATPLFHSLRTRLKSIEKWDRVLNAAEPVFLAGILCVVTAFLINGSFNPFLYFRF